jgi:two-component system, chemotaxis family, protein-glutamate methylesterase/glutaminase
VTPLRKIRVLVVDDSAVVRRCVRDVLSADPEIEVVGTAVDPYAARDLIAEKAPDVVTLDLEMPRMDGLTFLRLLMEHRPLPVLIMSSLTAEGSAYALEALRLGAVDVLPKPGPYAIGDLGPQLTAKIKAIAGARPRPAAGPLRPVVPRPASGPRTRDPRALILLGASTGGTEALREILTHLPTDLPGIVIVQHIPAVFSHTFADRLNQLCALEVREAADGDAVTPGTALIAPGNFHLFLRRRGEGYEVRVSGGPTVWHQRPAVDLLFQSALEAGAAPHCVAGLLTGMGRDGAEGLLHLRREGAITFAQDEATSVVFGMPRAAWENGATQNLLPVGSIARFLTGQCCAAAALAV